MTDHARTIVLWDIDNTLLNTAGAGRLAMGRAFLDLYGAADAFQRAEVSGRTDTAIFSEVARSHGIGEDRIRSEMTRFLDAYVPHLADTLREVSGGGLMPGIASLLDTLAQREDVVQGLGTGNCRRGGELKLQHFDIARFFPTMAGGFGEDSEDRATVIRCGIERLRNGVAADGRAARVVVIGDTPHDVEAAHANGAYALGVATGRNSIHELRASGAEAVLPDLADTERAERIICG